MGLTIDVVWTRCSLLELERLKAELEKENRDKNQELERKILEEAHSTKKLAAACKQINALEEQAKDVRCYV